MSEQTRIFYIQEDDDEVKKLTERKLRNSLKSGDLSGLELCRAEDEDVWGPLYARALYKEEVPVVGDPYQTARGRVLGGLKKHAFTFAIMSIVFTVWQGAVPFWLGFWALGLAFHAYSALTQANQKALGDPSRQDVPASHNYQRHSADPLDNEAEAIEKLVSQLDAPNKASVIAQVKALVATVRAAEVREQDLERQTNDEERATLKDELEEAKANVAKGGADQRVFEQQVSVLHDRLRAIDEAAQARAVLLAKKSVAVNQLKQLRLELSRASANQTALADLADRLEDVQLELSAQREVEDALGHVSVGKTAAGDIDADKVMKDLEAEIEKRIEARAHQANERSPQLGIDEDALEQKAEQQEQEPVEETVSR
jgi:hypothetical protein